MAFELTHVDIRHHRLRCPHVRIYFVADRDHLGTVDVLVAEVADTLLMIVLNDPKPIAMHDIVEDDPLIERASGNALRIVDFDAIGDVVCVPQIVFSKCLQQFHAFTNAPVIQLHLALLAVFAGSEP